jgi:hypothetical protein
MPRINLRPRRAARHLARIALAAALLYAVAGSAPTAWAAGFDSIGEEIPTFTGRDIG